MKKMKKPAMILGIASTILFSSYLPNATTAQASSNPVIDISKQYIGVDYVYGGTTPSGFDCSGFIQYVYKKAGVSLPRTTSAMYSSGSTVTSKQPGDLVFFATVSKSASHVGMYIGNNQFIHASTSQGVMISSLSNSYWNPRYIGAKRIGGGVVLGESTENYVQSAKELWNKFQKRTSLSSALTGEYNRLKQKSTNSNYKEYMLRSAHSIDSINNGKKLSASENQLETKMINAQKLDNSTAALYDDLSYELSRTEKVIGKVYGTDNRKALNDHFTLPAKIDRESVKYEVSMHRLMNQIEDLINKGSKQSAADGIDKLARLENRAKAIKISGNAIHSGSYNANEKINNDLQARKAALKAKIEKM